MRDLSLAGGLGPPTAEEGRSRMRKAAFAAHPIPCKMLTEGRGGSSALEKKNERQDGGSDKRFPEKEAGLSSQSLRAKEDAAGGVRHVLCSHGRTLVRP